MVKTRKSQVAGNQKPLSILKSKQIYFVSRCIKTEQYTISLHTSLPSDVLFCKINYSSDKNVLFYGNIHWKAQSPRMIMTWGGEYMLGNNWYISHSDARTNFKSLKMQELKIKYLLVWSLCMVLLPITV